MKAEGIKKRLSVRQYLNKVTSHLCDFINDHRIARRVCKIQLSTHVNFISSKDTGVELVDYKLHRLRLRRGGSYVQFSGWFANKKGIINPKNKNDDE